MAFIKTVMAHLKLLLRNRGNYYKCLSRYSQGIKGYHFEQIVRSE